MPAPTTPLLANPEIEANARSVTKKRKIATRGLASARVVLQGVRRCAADRHPDRSRLII
jgi:hypothetical protein